MRGRRRLVLALGFALVSLVAVAPRASAHASLVESEPANGARLERSPSQILLRFTEGVEVSLGGVRVFDRDGERVDRGRIGHPAGRKAEVAVGLPRLPDGGYVVTWRVVSADSHPVQGAFTFTVGDGMAAHASDVAELLGTSGASRSLGVAYAASRSVAFAALLTLLGAVAFVAWLWPAGVGNERFRRLAVVSLVVLALSSVANLALQGAYAAGLGLSDVASSAVIGDVLDTRFGRVYLARFGLLVVAAVLLAVLLRRRAAPAWWRWTALVVGVALAATPGLAGHAAIGSHQPYALIADVAHVAAAAVWLGALVMLLGVLLPTTAFEESTRVTQRFSDVALYAVGAIVVTGVFQAYRQVGAVDALRSTEYGKLVVVKSLLVGAVLCIALVSRRTVRRNWIPASVAALRRSVAIEAAIALGVLGVTSQLVNAVPARVLAAAPQSGELTSANLLLDYTVSPGRTGPNDIHLYTLSKTGQLQPVEEMTLQLSLPGRDIAPIEVALVKAGPGHYQALRFDIPFAGRWKLLATARTSEIDSEVFEGSMQIK